MKSWPCFFTPSLWCVPVLGGLSVNLFLIQFYAGWGRNFVRNRKKNICVILWSSGQQLLKRLKFMCVSFVTCWNSATKWRMKFVFKIYWQKDKVKVVCPASMTKVLSVHHHVIQYLIFSGIQWPQSTVNSVENGQRSLDSTKYWLLDDMMYQKNRHISLYICCCRNPTKVYIKFDHKSCWQTDACHKTNDIGCGPVLGGSKSTILW